MIRTRTQLTLIAILFAVSGCATYKVGLPYGPYGSVRDVSPEMHGLIAVGDFTDARGEDLDWLGAIRGDLYNPIKEITTVGPVTDVVKQAFADALYARGWLADRGAGPYVLGGTVKKLRCDQFFGAITATVTIDVILSERATGQVVSSSAKTIGEELPR